MQLRSRDALIVCLEATGMSERKLARVAGLGHATVNHLVTGLTEAGRGGAPGGDRAAGAPARRLAARGHEAGAADLRGDDRTAPGVR